MPVATRSLLQAAGNNGLLLPSLQMHWSSRQTRGCRFCTKIYRRGKDEWEVSLSRADLSSLHLLFRSNFRIDQSFKPRPAFSSPAKFSLSTAPLGEGFSASATSISLTSRLVFRSFSLFLTYQFTPITNYLFDQVFHSFVSFTSTDLYIPVRQMFFEANPKFLGRSSIKLFPVCSEDQAKQDFGKGLFVFFLKLRLLFCR